MLQSNLQRGAFYTQVKFHFLWILAANALHFVFFPALFPFARVRQRRIHRSFQNVLFYLTKYLIADGFANTFQFTRQVRETDKKKTISPS